MCTDPMCSYAGMCACTPEAAIKLTINCPHWLTPIIQVVRKVDELTENRVRVVPGKETPDLQVRSYLLITHLDGETERFLCPSDMSELTVSAVWNEPEEDEGPDEYDLAEANMCTDPNWMND